MYHIDLTDIWYGNFSSDDDDLYPQYLEMTKICWTRKCKMNQVNNNLICNNLVCIIFKVNCTIDS